LLCAPSLCTPLLCAPLQCSSAVLQCACGCVCCSAALRARLWDGLLSLMHELVDMRSSYCSSACPSEYVESEAACES